MKCPKCGFDYCTMNTNKKVTGKDYSIGKGMLGEMLFGSSGFFLGFSNSRETKVDVYWVCQKCGYQFMP